MRSTKKAEGNSRELDVAEVVLPCVDENLSYASFFQVYRYPDEPSIGASLNRTMAAANEVPIAKLFVIDLRGTPQLLVFTNQGLIVLWLNVGLRQSLWRLISLLKLIPVVSWILELLTEPFKQLVGKALRTSQKDAKRLLSVSDQTLLETKNSKTKVAKPAKGIFALWKSYPKIMENLQPSLGVSIQYRIFSYFLAKISVTTLRVLPLGHWLEVSSSIGGAAEYTLPRREVISKIGYLIEALPDSIPVKHTISGLREIRLQWPEEVGIGTKRWSMYAAALLTATLFGILVFLVILGASGNEKAYIFVGAIGFGAIQSLVMGRSLGTAIWYGLVGTAALVYGVVKAIGWLG